MKSGRIKLSIVILFALVSLQALQSEAVNPIRIADCGPDRIVMEFICPQAMLERVTLNGESYDRVSLLGAEPSAGEGAPDLPLFGSMVAIPVNSLYTISYELSDLQVFEDVKPSPVQDQSGTFTLSPAYFETASYPSRQVIASEAVFLRDFRVLPLQTCPFSWDPSSNTLTRYGKIRINIDLSYPKADSGPVPYTGYSSAFRNLYEARIQNFSAYRDLEPGPQSSRVLIIHGHNTDPVFVTKLGEFVSWKRQKGFIVSVASTQVAGTTNTAIKSYIQAQYDVPETRPDFIILIGDVGGSFAVPTFFETDSGHNGEGDYPYTYLSGNDMLGDAFIGRISAEDVSQLLTLFSKVYTYEKNVNINSPASTWMNRMLIIGDPTVSGISCAYTAHYIHDIAQMANPDYNFVENYSGGFVNTINSGLNQGVGFFAYRGYYGVSGWSPSPSIANGFKLPHAVILTCETGSFAGTSLSEEFIRMGTESVPAGAATCISLASPGTHTLYNNVLISGIMSGIFCFGMRTMGEALLNGRLYLHETYGASQPVAVKSLAHWCNLMGDPTLETWVGVARELHIEVPSSVPQGLNLLEVVVRDSLQLPVEGVSVTAWSPSQNAVIAKSFTMANGVAALELPTDLGTELLITAAIHDHKPSRQTLTVDGTGSLSYVAHEVIDDGSQGSFGNANGIANASETIALAVEIQNSTAEAISGLSAVISCDHPGIQISMGTTSYPDLGPGLTGLGSQAFIISIAPALAPIESIRIVIILTDSSSNQYQSVFYLQVLNARLSISGYSVIDGADGVLYPGEECPLSLEVSNVADYPALDLFGELHALNSLLVVSDSISYFGSAAPQSQIGSVDGFQVRARGNLVAGMQLPMRVRFYNAAGFEQTCHFNISIGTVSQNSPLGPDEYGYLIYDESDTAYPDCPVYEWEEIVPSLGGNGTLIPDLFDTGIGTSEGEVLYSTVLKEVPLPFSFRFYGIDYDRITVCVNGFIAFGSNANGDFRNAPLPGGQGPCPMIAAFWDDLVLTGSSGLYKYYDYSGHRFIIQYHNLTNGYDDSSVETFQVIFYDPLYHHSGMGDGIIKLQYKNFNNVDAGGSAQYGTPLHGNFCTIGIKDHTNTRGLEYTYNNSYPQAASPLADEKALLITTVPVHHQEAHLVVDEVLIFDGNNQIPEPGEDFELGLKLSNLGFTCATSISANLTSDSPYALVTAAQSQYADIASSGTGINLNPFVVSVSDSCPDGSALSFVLELSYAGKIQSFGFPLVVMRPALQFDGYMLNDAEGNEDGILEPGESAVFVVNFKNTTPIEAKNLIATLTSSHEHVNLMDTSQQIVSVPPWSTAQAAFRFTLSSSATTGSNLSADLGFVCDLMPAQTAQIQLQIGSSGLYDEFENSSGGFIPIPSSSGWQWGSDQTAGAHSGSNVWGTWLNQEYPNLVTWRLLSPTTVSLGPDNYLEFWQFLDTQSGCDGGRVEIYAFGRWTLLTPENGYPMSFVTALNGPGFSGNSAWSRVRCDLGAYADSSVRFRWIFSSDGSGQGQGWFLDDIRTIGFSNFAGKISGTIHLDGSQPELSEVWIGDPPDIAVNPNSDMTYTLYLPLGTHNVSSFAPGYNSETYADLELSLTVPSRQQNFVIHELKPVTSLASSHTGDVLTLHWEAPSDPFFPITAYKVSRRMNAGPYESVSLSTEYEYSELLRAPNQYHYYVQVIYDEGESLPSGILSVDFPFPDDPLTPSVTKLLANFPNPFNASTTISFDLAYPQRARIMIYNLRGQLVNSICDQQLEAGKYYYIWDGRDAHRRAVASGVYFYRLITPSHAETRKMLLMK